MKFDKRWIIGGVLLVGGGLFFMRRANAATAAPTVGSVMPGPVSSGSSSGGLNALAAALFASGSPAPAPTYTMTSASPPPPAPVAQAASVSAPAPAPAPAPIQSWGAAEWQGYVSASAWDPSGGGG